MKEGKLLTIYLAMYKYQVISQSHKNLLVA